MFSFLPMPSAGHLNDPSSDVPRRKAVPSLGAVVLSPHAEGTPSSSSSSPSFAQNGQPNQQMIVPRTDGTSPAGGGDAMSAGFPHLQPFFAALARNLSNISPQQQHTSHRHNAPNSVPPNSNSSVALSSPPFSFGHPNTFLARQQNAKQQQKAQQNSSPLVAEAQQQMVAHWLNVLVTTMHGAGSSNGWGSGTDSGGTAPGGGQGEGGAKTLESDSEGNSVCPACKETIGKEQTQWESHLEAERSRLRSEIESLRSAVLAVQNIAASTVGTATEHHPQHNEQQWLCEAQIALVRIRESQRQRVTAKAHGHFFTSSPILAKLIRNEDNKKNENDSEGDNSKKTGDEANGDGSETRQNANGFTVSPFSALELARGFKHNDGEEEKEKTSKQTTPEGMKRMSSDEMKRMSSDEMKRMSSDEMKRMSPEGVQRMRTEGIKRMSPEGMNRMSPEGMERISHEGMKRMSPEWMHTAVEEIKRPRLEF